MQASTVSGSTRPKYHRAESKNTPHRLHDGTRSTSEEEMKDVNGGVEGEKEEEGEGEGEAYETKHVHDVYSQIASHFSQTRHKPWPLIVSFLQALPAGSCGLDIGCGNGKYLNVNPNIFIIGSDRSMELIAIAMDEKIRLNVPEDASIDKRKTRRSLIGEDANQGSRQDGKYHADVFVADILSLPHPPGSFDFAISVAVIHHLSTRRRRIAAIQAMLEMLITPKIRSPESSRAPRIQNDTLEEKNGNARKGKLLIYVWALEQKSSRRGWDEGQDQDVMVSWVMKGTKKQQHGNQHEHRNDCPAPPLLSTSTPTFQRYYHLYRQGELEEDIQQAGGCVLDHGYEKDNWWAIASPA